jgi:hypothetical protein
MTKCIVKRSFQDGSSVDLDYERRQKKKEIDRRKNRKESEKKKERNRTKMKRRRNRRRKDRPTKSRREMLPLALQNHRSDSTRNVPSSTSTILLSGALFRELMGGRNQVLFEDRVKNSTDRHEA